MAKRKRDAAAATTIQALVHGAWTRFWLKRTGAAAQVERTWRGLQGRRQWKAEWVAIRQVCATQQVQVAIQASLSKELEDKTLDLSDTISSSVAKLEAGLTNTESKARSLRFRFP